MQIIHRDDIQANILNNKHESTWYVGREFTKGTLQYANIYSSHTGLNPVYIRLDRIWQRILRIFDYKTSGKKILELGCGAEKGNTESKYFDYKYQPWLGRFLYATRNKTGIDYIGADIGDLSLEKFQVNLLEKNCLINSFAENQFDLVIAYMLFDSSELEKQTTFIEKKMPLMNLL